jgi:hypothetical protein
MSHSLSFNSKKKIVYKNNVRIKILIHFKEKFKAMNLCKKYIKIYKKNYKLAECVTCVNFNAIDYTSGSSESKLKTL